MKFSEWLRDHQHHSPITTEVAHKWNLLSGAERRGRINAARLVRVLGIPPEMADVVMGAFEQYRGTLPTVVPAPTLTTEVEQSGAV